MWWLRESRLEDSQEQSRKEHQCGQQKRVSKGSVPNRLWLLIPVSLPLQWCQQPRPVEQVVLFSFPAERTQDAFAFQRSSAMDTIGSQSMFIIVGGRGCLELQKCPLVNRTDFQERKYIIHCSLSDSLDVPRYSDALRSTNYSLLPLHKLHRP